MMRYLTTMLLAVFFVAGCSKELPPRTADEFVDNPILLEAAMVRCAQDRAKTRYEAECINARSAIDRISVKEEAARKVEMEARSDAKRRALRRTQEAAAYARQRAAEARRLQEEEDYLVQFGTVPLGEDGRAEELNSGTTPVVVNSVVETIAPSPVDYSNEQPVSEIIDAPIVTPEPEVIEGSDLDAIRDELRRRNEDAVD